MAKRAASGRLGGLRCPSPAGECTSESEESVQGSPQHVPAAAPRIQRCGWQPGEDAEPWDLGTEDRTDSGDTDLEPALSSPTGEPRNEMLSSLFCLLPFPVRSQLLSFFFFFTRIVHFVSPSERVSHSLVGINRDEYQVLIGGGNYLGALHHH